MDRRGFIRLAGAGGLVAAGCRAPLPTDALTSLSDGVLRFRASGYVTDGTTGLAGVAVSDGRTVVLSDEDGWYVLHAPTTPKFIVVTTPAAYDSPMDSRGASRHFVPVPSGATDFSADFRLVPKKQGSGRAALLFLADPQVQLPSDVAWLARETLPTVRRTIEAYDGTTRIILGGDLVWESPTLLGEVMNAMAQLDLPVMSLYGNHDRHPSFLGDRQKEWFTDVLGPTYYSFETGDAHCVVLDTVDWLGYDFRGFVDAVQIAWLQADLRLVESGRTVVLLGHIPLGGTRSARLRLDFPPQGFQVSNAEEVRAALDRYVVHSFSGHNHEVEHSMGARFSEHICGAVCGAWWTGSICYDGSPIGFTRVEVIGEEVRWRYVPSEGSEGEALRVYAPGNGVNLTADLVANVWDWDERWRVRWWEDGEPKGLMERRRGLDPLSADLYVGPRNPERNPLIDPIAVDHLFVGRPSGNWSILVVVAEDGNGGRFEARVGRNR